MDVTVCISMGWLVSQEIRRHFQRSQNGTGETESLGATRDNRFTVTGRHLFSQSTCWQSVNTDLERIRNLAKLISTIGMLEGGTMSGKSSE